MASFTVEEIVKVVNGRILQHGRVNVCGGVSTDTRTIRANELFVPLIGEHFNGHRFIKTAAAQGAAAVIVSEPMDEKEIGEDMTVIAVEDTLRAYEQLACFHRCRFSIPVVAVTGSNGKTTTKEMIASVLGMVWQVRYSEKNFNNEIGLSRTLLSLTDTDEVCVVEMGMRGAGQIAELCRIARPTIGVITNVGNAHIGILGSQENIAKAKGELIQALPPSGIAVLNGDDDFVRSMADCFCGQVFFYGVKKDWQVSAAEIEMLDRAVKFQCQKLGESFPVYLPMVGIHNVYDALAAVAVGHLLGVPVEKIRNALAGFVLQGDSQKIERICGVLVLNDSYNANPLSMDMAFKAFASLPGKRHVLVLGDMLELGVYAEEMHREIGRKAALYHFDEMITVGSLARLYAEAAKEAGLSHVVCFDDCRAAGMYLRKEIQEGDAVLIKGSHAVHMETIPDFWRGAAD